jgi:hypothetical protein
VLAADAGAKKERSVLGRAAPPADRRRAAAAEASTERCGLEAKSRPRASEATAVLAAVKAALAALGAGAASAAPAVLTSAARGGGNSIVGEGDRAGLRLQSSPLRGEPIHPSSPPLPLARNSDAPRSGADVK